MNAMTPEVEMQISKFARLSYVASALMYRKLGDRIRMKIELNMAKCEKLKQKYFIGPCPF